MATLKQKRDAEAQMRELLEEGGLPQPDEVDYGETCIRLFWHDTKSVVIIDIDEEEEDEPPAMTEPPDVGELCLDERPVVYEPGMDELLRPRFAGRQRPVNPRLLPDLDELPEEDELPPAA